MEKYYDSGAILNNESYSAEERLEMAKLMLDVNYPTTKDPQVSLRQ